MIVEALRHEETSLVGLTVVAGCAARFGPLLLHFVSGAALVFALSIVFVSVGCRTRVTPIVFICALIIGVLPMLSLRSLQGLAPTRVGSTSAVIELVSDPAEQPGGGISCVVRVAHKRLRATSYGAAAQQLRNGTAGATFRVIGTVQEWSGAIPDWAVSKHLAGKITVQKADPIDNGSWPWRSARWVRLQMAKGATALPRDQRPLFGGFVLGDDRGQRVEVTDDFRAAGLSHLLVVSGQNVAFVLAAVAPLFQRLSPRVRAVLAVLVILGFAVVTRFEPSVLRASMMAGVAVTARAMYRPQPAIRLVCLAVLTLLLIDPLLSWSVGFGLSVGATVGLATLSGPIEDRLRRLRVLPSIRSPLAATLAAQIGTYPLLVGLGGVSPVSIPANLLALPVAEPLMVWGLIIGVPAGLLGQGAAGVLHLPNRLMITWVAGVARFAAMFVRRFPSQSWWPLMLGATCLIWCYVHIRPRRLVLIGIAIGSVFWVSRPDLTSAPIARGRVVLWREGGLTVALARPGVNGQNALSDLRALKVSSLAVLVIQRSTNASWTSIGPVVARHHAKQIVQCGISSRLDGTEVLGLADGDVLRIATDTKQWLRVTCKGGRAQIIADTATNFIAELP
jgi:competence protein ComEC